MRSPIIKYFPIHTYYPNNTNTQGLLPISIGAFFQSATDFVMIVWVGRVMSAATQMRVFGAHVASISIKSWPLRYGVSIIIWDCFNCCETFSINFIFAFLSSGFTGRYPVKAKHWPLRPLPISAIISEDGPTSGHTSMPCL